MNQSSGNKPVIHVRMFGGFTITMDDKTMSDSDNRSRKAWSLLSYLIIKRRGDVSINELFHSIWQDGIQENPYGALKTLVFRVRKMMETAGFPSQELILSQRGAYSWNSGWETEVDTDRFECLCRRILEPEDKSKDQWDACLEAFDLYTGIFLPKSAEESWVGPMAAYYHTLYEKLVIYMAGKLMGDKDYAKVEEICGRAIGIDRFVENFHYYWILAAYSRGEQKAALERYKATTDMFYRERLMTPSEHFKELYKIISSSEQDVVTNMDEIQETLGTGGAKEGDGAYQCEYAVFKRLVQLERRGVERSGDSVYLCLLTVGDRKGRTLKPEIQARAMERLRASIQSSLRSSDLYARYSVSQFILLLTSATFENSEMVMNRILSTFNKSYVRKDVAVNYSLDVLKP